MKTLPAAPSLHEIGQIEALLRQWFAAPAFVAAAAIDDHPMHPQEQALVANAVPRRQQEFATGRWLARRGLQQFGHPHWPLLTGRLRNPLWPASLNGSISHDGALCAAVLMMAAELPACGIDLVYLPQRSGRLGELAPMFVAADEELSAVAALAAGVDPAVLLFSVKESIVKAMSQRIGDFIDLRAIVVHQAATLRFSIGGEIPDTVMLAGVVGDYLLSAVKVHT
jgi:enterobactin synthetase component D